MTIREVTVFGAAGFVGRNIVRLLAENGIRVRAAARDPETAQFLKPMGNVGQVSTPQANLRFPESVAAAVHGVDAVINLAGILYESGAQSFEAVHVNGARAVAEAARNAGVARFIQMSALGAGLETTSKYLQSRADGEAAVREAFPEATILRPSVIFGAEDNFFNQFASLMRFAPAFPLIGGGQNKFQPVYVGDVADAAWQALQDPASAGQIYELGGPQEMTFEEVLRYIAEQIGRRRLFFPWPSQLAKVDAFFLQMLPRPLLTMDQVETLKYDSVADHSLPGLQTLGITPTPVEAVVPSYIARYRRAGRLTPSRFS